MPTINHFLINIKKYGNQHRPLYFFSIMILFFVIFDGIMTFLAPIAITEAGISEKTMGIILGFSSVAGIVCDFFLCWLFQKSSYRKIFLVMIILAAFFPILLWQAKSVFIFLVAMAIWGFYYDLLSIGIFDYIGERTKFDEHATSFGVVQFFQEIGYLIAPLLVGFFIGKTLGIQPYVMALVFLIISFLILTILSKQMSGTKYVLKKIASRRRITFVNEFLLWKKIGRYLLPVLTLTIILGTISGAVWTLGPLLDGEKLGLPGFASLFVFAFELPFLLVGWLVGTLTKNRSKKKVAFICLIIGGLLLGTLNLFNSPLILLIITFLSFICIALSWPAINGAYADYIAETEKYQKEIETIEDFALNIGYIIGPIIAGFSASIFGHLETIGLIGLMAAVAGIFLLIFTPKKINIIIK